MHRGFWWGSLRERGHLEDAGVDWRIIFKMDPQEVDMGVWTGSMWLRIRTGGGHL